jgi:hypothetical protein
VLESSLLNNPKGDCNRLLHRASYDVRKDYWKGVVWVPS